MRFSVKQLFYRCLSAAMSLVCFVQVLAQNITRPNIVGPAGLQVNSYVGNLFYTRSDLYIPAPGIPFDFTFAYNSSDHLQNWGYGFGWTFKYNQFYSVDSLGNVVVYREDGRRDFFKISNNEYTSPKGNFDRLTQYSPGKFRIRTKNGILYFFDDSQHKKLTSVKDRNDNVLTFGYTNNKLTSVSDAAGRTVMLMYNLDRLSEIKATFGSLSKSIKYAYDNAGCLIEVQNPVGDKMHYAYSANRVLSEIDDWNGNKNYIYYNSSFAVVKLVSCTSEKTISYNTTQWKTYETETADGRSIVTTYEFDQQGRLVNKKGSCCGFNISYAYDQYNNINQLTDANGNTTKYTYSASGNLLATTDPLGQSMHIAYDTVFSQPVTITDKKGNTTSFTYDQKGNLLQKQEPLGKIGQYSYLTNGKLSSRTDPRGGVYQYGYDANGNLLSLKDPQNNVTTFSNDAFGNILTLTDAKNNTTAFTYDLSSRIVKITNALNASTQFSFDPNGNILRVTDANNNKTEYLYDSHNLVIQQVNALGHKTSYNYDGFGNLVKMIDAKGHESKWEYDNYNRPITLTNKQGEISSFTYDNNGNRTQINLPNGSKTIFQYDPLNRLYNVSDNIGLLAKYAYDANSNLIATTDAKGNTTSYQYDELNRLLKKIDPLGNATSLSYDLNNNLTGVMDRMGRTTLNAYNNVNQKVQVTDALQHQTSMVYDQVGNISSISDAKGNITSYTYDALNRPLQERFADNSTKAYQYDAVGNMVLYKDNAGQNTNYKYDQVNRLIAKQFPVYTDSFQYDELNLLIRAKNRNADIQFSFDLLDRVTAENLNGHITAYIYNTPGKQTYVTYPNGRSLVKNYDTRGQLISIQEGNTSLLSIDYDLTGQIKNRRLGNNIAETFSYTPGNQVVNIASTPSSFLNQSYSYNEEENITAKSYNQAAPVTELYSYDANHQLTGFQKGNQVNSFSYDPIGNRTTAQLNGNNYNYTSSIMNAYTGISINGSSQAFSYDGNGNLASAPGKTLTYDAENRLETMNTNADHITYSYDALGRRIGKEINGIATKYYFSGLNIIEEDVAGNAKTFVWGSQLDDIISMNRNNENYFYHKNALGSVLAITNATGNIVEQYGYDAYGAVSFMAPDFSGISGSAIGNEITFSGKFYDHETGFYQSRVRTYDPSNGRFLQRDPLGYVDGLNIYSYVGNDPVNFIDPFGTIKWKALGLAAIGLAGNVAGTIAGVGLGVAAGWTGIGAVAGGVIAGKSLYGIGANAANITSALMDEDNLSTGSLFNDIANLIDPCSEALQWAATGLDILTDLSGLKVANKAAGIISREAETTVLGHWPLNKDLAKSINGNYLNVPMETWNSWTPTQQWDNNLRFLDEAIERGDNIRLATPIWNTRFSLSSMNNQSFYVRELDYLMAQKGYSISADGKWLIK